VGGAKNVPPASTGLRAGDRISRYRIERSIGRGGMGEVFVAVDEHLSRRVALKVLMADDETARARFLREARAAAAVHHANIATVFDAGEDRGLPFLAMELVEGGNLRDRVLDRSFTTVKRLTCLLDVARGLAEAHRHELVHRDVKPENVMLARDGAAKVVDFGIARSAALPPGSDRNAAQAVAKLSTITRGEVLIGTVAYMSPEQILNEPLDGRSDQFSWGVVAYELLTGCLPWQGETTALLGAILTRDAAPLASHDATLPEPIAAIIHRALRRPREERFASMDELAAALYVALPAVAAEAVPPLSSVPAEVMRDALQFGATAANISYDRVVDTGALTAADTGGGRNSVQQTTASPGAPARPRWMYGAFASAVALVAALGSGLVAHSLRAPRPPVEASSARVEPPPPGALGLLDLPKPTSCNAAALAAFDRGLRALRAGSSEAGCVAFLEATTADATCSAAWLRAASACRSGRSSDEVGPIYQRAASMKDRLTPRERDILDALEPTLGREPADATESGKRFARAAAEHPEDLEITFEAVFTGGIKGDDAIVALDRVIAADPGYSDAWQSKGRMLARAGKVDAALETLEDCKRKLPSSSDCAYEAAQIHLAYGRCTDAVHDARTIVVRDPTSPKGQALLVFALAGEDASADTLDEALKSVWPLLPEARRDEAKSLFAAKTRALSGDFEGALRELAVDATVNDVGVRMSRAVLRVELLSETAPADEVDADAEQAIRKSRAWSSTAATPLEYGGLAAFPELRLLAARNERAAQAELPRTLAETMERRSGRIQPVVYWAVSKALFADGAAAARAALADPVVADGAWLSPPPSPFNVALLPLVAAARTLVLAGHARDAIPIARAAARTCNALLEPVLHTRAELVLAEAIDGALGPGGAPPAVGDAGADGGHAEACEALAVIDRRWGKTKAKTAERAAKLAKKLKCK
jgi:serine/threonine-protein kinase